MTTVVEDPTREVRGLVRDVVSAEVAELVRLRTTSPETLRVQLARVDAVGAFVASRALQAAADRVGPTIADLNVPGAIDEVPIERRIFCSTFSDAALEYAQ